MRHLIAIASSVLLAALSFVPAQAEKRVALVIGNGAYKSVPALPNPTNDAEDVASAFTRLDFSVTQISDANFDRMRRALIAFGREARESDIAVVFFAGHGMEIGGENWLIPIDAELRSDTDAENEAIALRSAMLQVAGANRLGLVILDACRNNPFAAKMQRSIRNRAVDRGLVRTEPTDNVLVAYAARDGTTASDGAGRNSPFTAALLKHVETPGLEIRYLFASVRDDVMASTNRVQQPFVYGSLSSAAIYFRPPMQGSIAAAVPTASPIDAAAQAWAVTKDTSSVAVLQQFIQEFGGTIFVGMARARLVEL
jgi:uncharacterized caspase-like protein